ncbi:MAG: recombinase RecA [Candidatus Cloacimonadota bacterium]|nr:MAG: recombinase RecA [Candidatus Cloacimonadota bacterium]
MTDKEKKSQLKNAVEQIEKRYGVGAIMRLGDRAKVKIDVIPTGAYNLDAALGIGGIPRGRITEIYGSEASGKTTLALHIAAEAQKQNGIVAFIDAEHALDPIYAHNLGVNTDEMLISQPDSGEQALEIVEALIRSNAVDAVIVDSVAALVPRAEIEGDMGDSHVGLQARLMSQALRKLTSVICKSNCALVFINQTRMKIGTPAFMDPHTTTGGLALKFYTSVRIEVRRSKNIKNATSDSDVIGNDIVAKIVKNKLAPPFKKVTFGIIYGKGISQLGIVIDEAIENKIITKRGAWFSYGDIRIGQGKENTKNYLRSNPEIYKEIEHKVKLALKLESPDQETSQTNPSKQDDNNKDTKTKGEEK